LITIVVLMVIIGAVAIPNISPVVLSYRLRGAAWQVAGDLRLARQRAVTVRKRFRVCVSNCAMAMRAGTYSVERDNGTVSSPNWVNETSALARLPQDVAISSTATVTFGVTGIASAGTFTVSNLMGTYTVAVNATGRVRVCKGSCS
jgi:Tfp pilus assembly protein FimT